MLLSSFMFADKTGCNIAYSNVQSVWVDYVSWYRMTLLRAGHWPEWLIVLQPHHCYVPVHLKPLYV